MSSLWDFQPAFDIAFHSNDSPTPLGSTEYKDAATFVRQLHGAMCDRRRRGEAGNQGRRSSRAPHPALEFPATFNTHHRINVSLVPDTVKYQVLPLLESQAFACPTGVSAWLEQAAAVVQDALERGQEIARRLRMPAPASAVNEAMAEYKQMLTMFEDMQQKKGFAKASAMQQARTELPIAAFRDDVVRLVTNNPTLILAGVHLLACSLL